MLGSEVLWKIVIEINAKDETMKRKTAISIGLNSITAARMPTKDDVQKTTASIIKKMGISLWAVVFIQLSDYLYMYER